jgi:hypothetical protein
MFIKTKTRKKCNSDHYIYRDLSFPLNDLVIALEKSFRFVSAPENPNNLLLVLDNNLGLALCSGTPWLCTIGIKVKEISIQLT